MVGRNLFSEIPLQLVHLLMRICEVLKATRSGPKIPAVGPFGGGFLFGLDKYENSPVLQPTYITKPVITVQ